MPINIIKNKKIPAVPYSPTESPPQYHQRWKA
jgi:hypothetical protein